MNYTQFINNSLLVIIIASLGVSSTSIASQHGSSHPVSFAQAKTCIGIIDIHIVRPTQTQMRWRASLKLPNNKSFDGYFWQTAKKPTTSKKNFAKNYPEFATGIRQVSTHGFKMRKKGAPDCNLEMIDYGVLLPAQQPNLYGALVAPLILMYDEETGGDSNEWGADPNGPEVTTDSWGRKINPEEVDKQDTGEIIGGANNPWENPGDPDSWDKDGDGYHDADTNEDGVVDFWEELSWTSSKIKYWFKNGGILSLF